LKIVHAALYPKNAVAIPLIGAGGNETARGIWAGPKGGLEMNISDLRQRAESGSVVAQTALGVCYLEGIDVEVDYEEAFRLLSSASDQGVPRALANLARMYADGLGIPKSVTEAVRLYERAAAAGEFLAQIELGRIYSRSVVVPTNPDLARRWYSAALAQEGQVDDCEELREAKAYLAQ
jgi:TPR repeat protein